MKVLLINGSPHEKGCTNRALEEVKSELAKNQIESQIIWLGIEPMQDCIACNGCKTTGKCVFDDKVNMVSEKLDNADGFVIGSPVYYGGPNGRICSFMDRLCYSSAKKLENKVCASVVSCRRGGATATYQRLNMYFGMLNTILATSQYWNQVHGKTPDGVEKDEEGLQTMRTLANNIAFLLKSLKAGEKIGIEKPSREVSIKTSIN